MNRLLNVIVALLVFTLPFVVASCGDDDEAPTYTYAWEYSGIDFDDLSMVRVRNNVNQLIALAYSEMGYEVSLVDKKFSIQAESAVKSIDEDVKEIFLLLMNSKDFKDVVYCLPSSARVILKRGAKILVDEKLNWHEIHKHEYTWTLLNTGLSSSATTQEKQEALTAEAVINSLLAVEFSKQGFTVDATNQKFSVLSENEAAPFDNRVRSTFYYVKAQDAYLAAAEKLPRASKLVVKRGSTNIINESLK